MSIILYHTERLHHALTQWQNYLQKQRDYSDHTCIAYRKDVFNFFHIIGQKYKATQDITDCGDYTADDFRDFLKQRKENHISHQSMARNLSAIRSFFSYLEDQYHIKNDRLNLMRAPKKPKLLPHPICFEDIQKAAHHLKYECDDRQWVRVRNFALMILLYGTGLRISEALSITTAQTFHDTLKITGKGKKDRIVPLLPFVQNAMNEYRALCPFNIGGDDIIFRSIKGKELSSREARLILEKMRIFCNLPDYFTPHALRHSCASHMLSGGSDLRIIQDLLGHNSLGATEKYLSVNVDHLKSVFKKAHPRA